MLKRKGKKRTAVILSILLCLGVTVGLVLGRYAGEWKHGFGLQVTPVGEQVQVDHTLRRYFRSNELLPVSEGASYAVNGTSAWFTVANGLDSSTVSEDTVSYTLTWYVSEDGAEWTQHKKISASFAKNTYQVNKYTVEPVLLDGTTCNYVKVCGSTSSFTQEDIEAVYTFTYSEYQASVSYENGVIYVTMDTNDRAGEYEFAWSEGIVPDHSNPTGLWSGTAEGPSQSTLNLGLDTAYEFLFFVTDGELLTQLNADPSAASTLVTFSKK